MEFGYTEAPHKSFPVVFDSPRNRGLKHFPYKRILVCGKGRSGGPLGGSSYRTSLVLVLVLYGGAKGHKWWGNGESVGGRLG